MTCWPSFIFLFKSIIWIKCLLKTMWVTFYAKSGIYIKKRLRDNVHNFRPCFHTFCTWRTLAEQPVRWQNYEMCRALHKHTTNNHSLRITSQGLLPGVVVLAGTPCAEASALDVAVSGLSLVPVDLCHMSSPTPLPFQMCGPLSNKGVCGKKNPKTVFSYVCLLIIQQLYLLVN